MGQSQALFIAGDANATVQGLVRLTGDFGGSAVAPKVVALNGVTLPTGSPTNGQTLLATGPTTFVYGTPSAAAVAKKVVPYSYNASLALNTNTTDVLTTTATGPLNFTAPTGSPTDRNSYQFEVTQDGTGSRAVTFDTTAFTASASNPIPAASTAINKTDIWVFQYNAALGKYRYVGGNQGY